MTNLMGWRPANYGYQLMTAHSTSPHLPSRDLMMEIKKLKDASPSTRRKSLTVNSRNARNPQG
jgi:hypothetical protein